MAFEQSILTGMKRAWQARRALEGSSMPSQDVPNDDDIRTTHNFAPGYYGLVYRADTPPPSECEHHKRGLDAHEGSPKQSAEQHAEPQYKLQAMKWGTSYHDERILR